MQGTLERIGTIQAAGNRGAGSSFAKRFDLVLQARNGVAHIGDDGGLADEVAQLAVRGANEILQMMGRSIAELFGDYTDAAKSLLSEHSTKVQQLVTSALPEHDTASRTGMPASPTNSAPPTWRRPTG